MQPIVSAGLILGIVLWGVVAPHSLAVVFDTALAVITRDFGWLYLWVVLGLVILAMVLAFRRYGDLKLGCRGRLWCRFSARANDFASVMRRSGRKPRVPDRRRGGCLNVRSLYNGMTID